MTVNHDRTRSLARHWHLAGDGPDEGRHVPGDRHHHLVGMFPSCCEVSDTLTQAHLGIPPDVLDGLGELLQAQLEMAADLGRIPVGPSSRNEGPAGERVASCSDAALAAAFATGVLTGGETQRAHERSRVLETGEVAELSDEGDGHRTLDAAHGLESLDDGGQAPSLDLLSEFGLETLEPFLM